MSAGGLPLTRQTSVSPAASRRLGVTGRIAVAFLTELSGLWGHTYFWGGLIVPR